MILRRHPGRLAGSLVLAFALVLLVVLVRPAPGGASSGVDGAVHGVYLPVVQQAVPTATPTPPAGCSTAPVLIAPADGATLDTLIPKFEWDSGQDPNATATNVQVYADPGLTDRVSWASSSYHPTGPYSWRFRDNYDPATTYYWLAFIECGAIRGPNSQVRSFTTGSGGVILPGPNLLEPADGATLAGASVTTSWSPVSGAVQYEDFMAHGTSLSWGIGTGTQDSWTRLEPNTIYEWWVRARNDYAWSADSVHRHFTTGPASRADSPAAWPAPFAAPRPAGRAFSVRASGGAAIEIEAP